MISEQLAFIRRDSITNVILTDLFWTVVKVVEVSSFSYKPVKVMPIVSALYCDSKMSTNLPVEDGGNTSACHNTTTCHNVIRPVMHVQLMGITLLYPF